MKTITTLVCCVLLIEVEAQLMNGSFEEGLNGWGSTCACLDPSTSPDVPGSTGNWSARVKAPLLDGCSCAENYWLYQAAPWITSGQWNLSFWMKAHEGELFDIIACGITSGPEAAIHVFGSSPETDWTYHSVIGEVPPGATDVQVVLTAGIVLSGDHYAYFDDIQISDLATGLPDAANAMFHPAFRPNPATDKLWVDMAETPTSISCVDASGLHVQLRTFRHAGRTVEVDLSSVSAGLCVMLMKTSSGIRTLRFMKA